jgi:hypothetical protein
MRRFSVRRRNAVVNATEVLRELTPISDVFFLIIAQLRHVHVKPGAPDLDDRDDGLATFRFEGCAFIGPRLSRFSDPCHCESTTPIERSVDPDVRFTPKADILLGFTQQKCLFARMGKQMNLPDRWAALSPEESMKFTNELHREVCGAHILHATPMKAVARLNGRDDFLFCGADVIAPCYVVHLTWREERSPDFPWVTEFSSLSDFNHNWKRIWD